MESDTEEVEIKIEYNENYDTDPLSQKRVLNRMTEDDDNSLLERGDSIEKGSLPDEIRKTSEKWCSGDSKETLNDGNYNKNYFKTTTWYSKINSRGRYLCKFCTHTYLTTQTLRHHVKIKHSVQAKVLEDTVKHNIRKPKIKCHICKEQFKVIAELTKHFEENHSGDMKVACHICNASFEDRTELNDHLILKHGVDINVNQIFSCDICGYKTLKKSHFTQHRHTHFNENTQKCEYCDYATTRAANLKIHKRIHTNQKPYSCDFDNCAYKCSTKSGLESHKRRHNCEKNLICDRCSYKTIYKQSLKKHMNSHANNSVRAPFTC